MGIVFLLTRSFVSCDCDLALWPLFHYLLWQDVATEYASADSYWAPYAAVNEAFAKAVEKVYKPGEHALDIRFYPEGTLAYAYGRRFDLDSRLPSFARPEPYPPGPA